MEKNLILFSIIVLPFTWTMSQAYKMVIGNKLFGKKVNVQNFFADGNFPSTHSATSVATASSIIFLILEMEDKILALTMALIVLATFEVFKTLRDACGCRYRQDKTNRLLRRTVRYLSKIVDALEKDKKIDTELTVKIANLEEDIEREAKKRVGHKVYEVLGGALLGFISFSYMLSIFFYTSLMYVTIPISLFYFWFFIKYMKRKKNKEIDKEEEKAE